MTNTKDIIIQLKKVREEKGYSYTDILDLMKENNDYLSKSTLSRIFAEGSENLNFNYEDTIRPIAKAILSIEQIEDTDNMDVAAMKTFLKFKIQKIEELEAEIAKLHALLDHEKVKYHEKLDKERAIFDDRIDFLKRQIDLKDERMDKLLDAVFTKDKLYNELLEKTLNCHCCPNAKE